MVGEREARIADVCRYAFLTPSPSVQNQLPSLPHPARMLSSFTETLAVRYGYQLTPLRPLLYFDAARAVRLLRAAVVACLSRTLG